MTSPLRSKLEGICRERAVTPKTAQGPTHLRGLHRAHPDAQNSTGDMCVEHRDGQKDFAAICHFTL